MNKQASNIDHQISVVVAGGIRETGLGPCMDGGWASV